MGFTIDDALREFKKNYKMTLLAGEDGCSNAMTWVQMVEDKTILQQLWGKELGSLTLHQHPPKSRILKTLVIYSFLSFFIVKSIKISVVICSIMW